MQIVEKGNGDVMEDGRYEVLARYVEEQITADGTGDTLSLNTIGNLSPHPDEFSNILSRMKPASDNFHEYLNSLK